MDIDAYESEGHLLYARLAATVHDILTVVARDIKGCRVQQIQHRAKAATSLREKLANRGIAEGAMIEGEIKDLAGCRLILYTNADVERFLHSRAIFDNFEIDQDRTKFHYPASADATEGFFISYNYAVRLKDNRTALPEYADLAGLWCEIQVQTTLGHAWSEMSHDNVPHAAIALSAFSSEKLPVVPSSKVTP